MSETRLDDRSLIERAQADPSHFSELYENNLDGVFLHVLRRCGSRSLAEDVTSETFLRALRALPRFEWRGVPYLGYLRRIADNVLTDLVRRDPGHLDLAGAPDGAVTHDTESDDQLVELLAKLPDDQRLVLALRFAEDQSIAQVAAVLGRSEGAIKQLQHRALAALRAWLAAQPSEDHS